MGKFEPEGKKGGGEVKIKDDHQSMGALPSQPFDDSINATGTWQATKTCFELVPENSGFKKRPRENDECEAMLQNQEGNIKYGSDSRTSCVCLCVCVHTHAEF